MPKLKPLLMLLTIIFLNSCDTFPTIGPKERCLVDLASEEPHCRCYLYQWNSDTIGKIGPAYDKEIMYCDKLIGYNPEDTTAIYEWKESIRLWLKRKGKTNGN